MIKSQKGSAPAAALSAIGLILIGALIWWAFTHLELKNDTVDLPDEQEEEFFDDEDEDGNQNEPLLFSTVKIALLDTSPEGEADRGCDDVVLIDRTLTVPTTQPLNAALTQLFLLNDEQVDGNFSFIARTNDTLRFVRATIDDGTAFIHLEGELTGLAGVCDDPRAKIQIEETALQFPTVDAVRIFLNGVETDLQPSQR